MKAQKLLEIAKKLAEIKGQEVAEVESKFSGYVSKYGADEAIEHAEFLLERAQKKAEK